MSISTTVTVKSRVAGKQPDTPALSDVILTLFEEQLTVRELIAQTVEEQIRDLMLNNRLDAMQRERILNQQYLSNDDIDAQAQRDGRIGMPRELRDDAARIDVQRAIARAIDAFVDDVYLIVVDGQRMETLDEVMTLSVDTSVTFMRLTPLVGG